MRLTPADFAEKRCVAIPHRVVEAKEDYPAGLKDKTAISRRALASSENTSKRR
jgi:hypothetical protein